MAIAALFALPAAAAPRVLSLDQCADQYVLALSPRAQIVGLSNRALNKDSWLRTQAAGLPQGRADSEAVLAARPTMVVRYWGGEPRLLNDLRRRGIQVVTIADANDFKGVIDNIQVVAAALGQGPAGRALIDGMAVRLKAGAGAGQGAGAVYLTSGGATAGRGTLINAILLAAGLTNLTPGLGYRDLPMERLVIAPPKLVVRGFFDAWMDGAQHWGPGRQARRLTARRSLVDLPGSLLGCPAWFAADAALAVATRARKG